MWTLNFSVHLVMKLEWICWERQGWKSKLTVHLQDTGNRCRLEMERCVFSGQVECVCVCSIVSNSFCDLVDCSFSGSSVQQILQARTLEWVVISSPRGSSQLRGWTQVSWVSCIGRWILCHCTTRESPKIFLNSNSDAILVDGDKINIFYCIIFIFLRFFSFKKI